MHLPSWFPFDRRRFSQKSDVIARMMYAHFAFYIVAAAIWTPDSMSGFMLYAFGTEVGIGALALTTIIGALVCADVIVNDVLPKKFSLPWIRRRRHWLYSISAWLFLAPIFTATKFDIAGLPQIWLFVGMAVYGLVLGCRDAASKRASPPERRRQCDV